jgi:hypothetical protein
MATIHYNLKLVLHACTFSFYIVLCTESIGGVVYSSNSDKAEKQRDDMAGHLPTAAEANRKELTANPPVYTSSESPLGDKGLDQRPLLTTATSSPPVYSSSEKGLDGQLELTTATLSPPVYSSSEKGLDGQLELTTATLSPLVYSSSEKGLDGQLELTTATLSPPVYTSSENPGEKGPDEQPSLTTQTSISLPTTATPTTSGIIYCMTENVQ